MERNMKWNKAFFSSFFPTDWRCKAPKGSRKSLSSLVRYAAKKSQWPSFIEWFGSVDGNQNWMYQHPFFIDAPFKDDFRYYFNTLNVCDFFVSSSIFVVNSGISIAMSWSFCLGFLVSIWWCWGQRCDLLKRVVVDFPTDFGRKLPFKSLPWAPKTMKNTGFGHLKTSLFTIKASKNVGVGGPW